MKKRYDMQRAPSDCKIRCTTLDYKKAAPVELWRKKNIHVDYKKGPQWSFGERKGPQWSFGEKNVHVDYKKWPQRSFGEKTCT